MANTKPDILFCAVVCAERAAYASPFVSSHFEPDEQPKWPAHVAANKGAHGVAVVSADVEPNFAAIIISYGGAHVKAHGSADLRADGAAFPVPLWSADATSNGLTDE